MKNSQCVIVTGGANGIGLAVVHHLGALGWPVGVLDRDRDGCDELQREDPGCQSLLVKCADVGVEEDVAASVSDIAGHFGRVDGLINNAGGGCAGPDITEWSLEQWSAGIAMNLTGAFLCSKHAVGVPQDIAALTEFLLDDEKSGFVSGQNFCVDGGMTVKMIYEE